MRAIKGEPNWLQLNVKVLSDGVTAKIDEYEKELRESASARLNFWKKSGRSMSEIPMQEGRRIAAAWKSILGESYFESDGA